VMPHLRVFQVDEPYHRLLVRFIALHRARVLQGGWLFADELEAAVARLEAHLAESGTGTLYATFFQAWGRVPE
jgi:hypothetical protein